MADPLLDAEAEARALIDAAGQLETLAQERDTARELCRDAIDERDRALAEVERLKKYEPRILEAHLTPGEATARVKAPFAQDFALTMAALLVEHDAPNYIETKVEHVTAGTIAVTVQRCAGKTPHQFRLEAESDRDEWREAARLRTIEADEAKAEGAALSARLAAAEAKVKDLEQLLAFGRAVSPSLLDSVSNEDARILSAWAAVRHHELDAARLARNAAEARVAELEAELADRRPGASP